MTNGMSLHVSIRVEDVKALIALAEDLDESWTDEEEAAVNRVRYAIQILTPEGDGEVAVTDSAVHIRLVCWDHRHVQAISPEQLRQLRTAPVCTLLSGTPSVMCGSSIWAVEHEGEPTRYVGRAPHWQSWADCIPGEARDSDRSEECV